MNHHAHTTPWWPSMSIRPVVEHVSHAFGPQTSNVE